MLQPLFLYHDFISLLLFLYILILLLLFFYHDFIALASQPAIDHPDPRSIYNYIY